jgi:hypothetical protein
LQGRDAVEHGAVRFDVRRDDHAHRARSRQARQVVAFDVEHHGQLRLLLGIRVQLAAQLCVSFRVRPRGLVPLMGDVNIGP